MKNKILMINLILFFGLTKLSAQEIIPATGGNATGSGGSVSYSVGQVVYSTKTGIDGSLAEGVQQPFEISVITGIDYAIGISLKFTAYPNPTIDFLTLQIEGPVQTQYFASLYDMTGKLIKTQKIEGNLTSIDMNNLISATYFLKVVQAEQAMSKEIKTFKIIKN